VRRPQALGTAGGIDVRDDAGDRVADEPLVPLGGGERLVKRGIVELSARRRL
jgi:hypothetical protein